MRVPVKASKRVGVLDRSGRGSRPYLAQKLPEQIIGLAGRRGRPSFMLKAPSTCENIFN